MKSWKELRVSGNPGVTVGKVQELEKKLGVQFPNTYKSLVHYADEAIFEVGQFTYGSTGEETGISEFFECSAEERPYTLGFYTKGEKKPALIIPFARDANDWQLCFDYRNGQGQEPAIILRDPSGRQFYSVAQSFDSFIEGLHE